MLIMQGILSYVLFQDFTREVVMRYRGKHENNVLTWSSCEVERIAISHILMR